MIHLNQRANDELDVIENGINTLFEAITRDANFNKALATCNHFTPLRHEILAAQRPSLYEKLKTISQIAKLTNN